MNSKIKLLNRLKNTGPKRTSKSHTGGTIAAMTTEAPCEMLNFDYQNTQKATEKN
jgi:hypothetical protein